MFNNVLQIKHCSVQIEQRSILDNISCAVSSNEIISIIGPSGSGKTTLLRCIAGLQEYTGTITHDTETQRNIGFVDQHRNLFPHLTVLQNIAYPLKIRHLPTAEIELRILKIMHDFQIEHLAKQFPQNLSGGEQQRVAIARSLIYNPTILLLDEPFAGLDALLRYDFIHWLKQLLQKQPRPTLFVTHDLHEAKFMSQTVLCLIDGKIAAQGTWPELEQSTNPAVRALLTHQL